MSLEFNEKPPDVMPASLPVYRLAEPGAQAAADRLSQLARRLGLRGRPHGTAADEDWTTHLEGVWEIGVHARSGAIVARNRERYMRAAERPFEIADDEAQRIALSFVGRLELLPLDEVTPRAITHLRTAGGDVRRGPREERLLDAGVMLGRSIKDVPVDGPGAVAMVNIDPDGEVVGVRSAWRPVAGVAGDMPLVGPDVAYRAMEEIAGRVRGDVTVTKARFGYFEQGVHDAQTFLQPAYMMVYVVRDKRYSYRSAEVVAAGRKLFEALSGDKRFGGESQEVRDRPSARRRAA